MWCPLIEVPLYVLTYTNKFLYYNTYIRIYTCTYIRICMQQVLLVGMFLLSVLC